MRQSPARVVAAALLLVPALATAQSVLERTPNLHGGWTGDAGMLHFNVVHRFNHSGAPERQVQSRPTFLLAWSPADPLLFGINYATRSALRPRVPNEWEPFVRLRLRPAAAATMAVQAGWNSAARSPDGELTAAWQRDRLRLLGGLRFLGRHATDSTVRVVPSGGAVLRVHEHLALAADVARNPSRARGTPWGVGLQARIPTTPHTLALHATSVDATTLHAASIPAQRVRWGFEFTIPITPARYFGRPVRTAAPPTAPTSAADTVIRVRMHNLRYLPDTLRIRAGTTVEWHNEDPLPHTVTAIDGSWDSGEIAPGAAWRHTFARAGTFDITCTPHPFMRAVLIVAGP